MLLRRVFLVSAGAWVAAIPLATWAATRPAASAPIYGFALGVYAIGRVVCHQLPLRSFHLWGASLPVCARCAGIYAAAAATAIMLAATERRRLAGAQGAKADPKVVLLLACVPTAATLVFEWTTGITPSNWIRALAGAPLGAAVAWAIGMVN